MITSNFCQEKHFGPQSRNTSQAEQSSIAEISVQETDMAVNREAEFKNRGNIGIKRFQKSDKSSEKLRTIKH